MDVSAYQSSSIPQPLVGFDTVLDKSEQWIETSRRIMAEEPFFAGHYPGAPIFPGVFIIEMVLQSATWLCESQGMSVSLMALRSVRLSAPVYPGDVLSCRAEVGAETDGELDVRAVCKTNDNVVAKIRLQLARGIGC